MSKNLFRALCVVLGLCLAFCFAASCESDDDDDDKKARCLDADGDGYGVRCKAGADCDDDNINVWNMCDTCTDADRDGAYAGCNQYVTLTGPDCDDSDPNVWFMCDDCEDGDGDGYYANCDALITLLGPDCNDANPLTYPSAPEVCDLDDNQCPGDPGYGEVDEGFGWQKINADKVVTDKPGGPVVLPGMVYSGSEHGLIYEDRSDDPDQICKASTTDPDSCNFGVFFQRLDISGDTVGLPVALTTKYSFGPSIAWSGSEYAATYTFGNLGSGWADQVVQLINPDGTLNGGYIRIGFSGAPTSSHLGNPLFYYRNSSIAWTGSAFGVAWQDFRDFNLDIYFNTVTPGGTLGTEIQVTTSLNQNERPSLAWTGSEFGLVFEDGAESPTGGDEIIFARLTATGAVVAGFPAALTTDPSGTPAKNPRIEWNGSDFAVTWNEKTLKDGVKNHEVYLALFPPEGPAAGASVFKITDDNTESVIPVVKWNGENFGLAWLDNPANQVTMKFLLMGPDGSLLSSALKVSNPAAGLPHQEKIGMAWTDTTLGLTLSDSRNGSIDVNYVHLDYYCPAP